MALLAQNRTDNGGLFRDDPPTKRGEGFSPAPRDRFTAHVFACLLEIGASDARVSGSTLGETLGLCASELGALVAAWSPATANRLAGAPQPAHIVFDEEEQQLLALFHRYSCDDSRESHWLAAGLTRRCMAPNHLWQDLGLHSRDELNRLMRERFPDLAARNLRNMKWKKHIYRSLCELEGFSLCAAPSCSECADYAECFGEESGLSRIAPDAEALRRPLRNDGI
jgi:nitrogen fixation protein NifQ